MLSLRTFGEDICKPPPVKNGKEEVKEEAVEEQETEGADGGAIFEAEEAGVLDDEEVAANT